MANGEQVLIPNVHFSLIKNEKNNSRNKVVCFRYAPDENNKDDTVWANAVIESGSIHPSRNHRQFYDIKLDEDKILNLVYTYNGEKKSDEISAHEFKDIFNESRPKKAKPKAKEQTIGEKITSEDTQMENTSVFDDEISF